MNFNEHYNLRGKHSFLSPSNYHWLNYDDAKLKDAHISANAAKEGTELHKLAEDMIKHKVMPEEKQETLSMYIRDAIYYELQPERLLYFSDRCFGTADAISFDESNGFLRIHDLKTGLKTPGSMNQLLIYAAIFCHEYGIQPEDIDSELRIYQFNDVFITKPTAEEVRNVMNRIDYCDRYIHTLENGGL